MKYIGYGLKYDKWKSDDVIVDLDDDDGCSDNGVPSLDRRQLSSIARKFHLFEVKIGLSLCLSSGRKSSSINDTSFEFLHFEALVHQGIRKLTRGKIAMYDLPSLSRLD